MPLQISNLDWLRQLAPAENPQLGQKLYEALKSIQEAHNNVETQTNTNSQSQPNPPPPIQALNVTAKDGIFHLSVTHQGEIYRGVNYHAEYSTNAQFTNPIPIDMGSSREHRAALGNLNLHFRAAASYGISPPTRWVYFGGEAQPKMVPGGGAATGPALPTISQGSGTGLQRQGLQGPGTTPYRSKSGALPVRGGKVKQV
jgi:hypothetical protein